MANNSQDKRIREIRRTLTHTLPCGHDIFFDYNPLFVEQRKERKKSAMQSHAETCAHYAEIHRNLWSGAYKPI